MMETSNSGDIATGLIGRRLTRVQYVDYNYFGSLPPWNQHGDQFDYPDALELGFEGSLYLYLASAQDDALQEVSLNDFSWLSDKEDVEGPGGTIVDMTESAKWSASRGRDLTGIEFFCHRRAHVQDLRLSFGQGHDIFISADSRFRLISNRPHFDRIAVLLGDEKARHYQVGPYRSKA